ncbi:MAG: uracil-DNA glycosylase [Peptoclostridium sp.]|uniref:uracil-DNA glycosylase n=1 Tax=Peptoclostridium sp. TaxID=1904860 RepID=UPI00139B3932|nr:uracil-DNA glycosylase [Peptoclostridium sp.]MZQ74797.1 uracil-DNA glycosylase [Peptoclostridium sp.]
MEKLFERCTELSDGEEFVFSDGRTDSGIMLIGEAPGENEVKLKKPFVGKAGKNLDEFISILGIEREDIYITNAVKIRPHKLSLKTGKRINRSPSKAEVDRFRELVVEEIKMVTPKIIVTLGNTPLKQLLQREVRIGDMHGTLMELELGGRIYSLFPLYHPASIIYNRDLRQIYIDDLARLREIIHRLGI